MKCGIPAGHLPAEPLSIVSRWSILRTFGVVDKTPAQHTSRDSKHTMQYRKEIDGLRAIAVISVIWFHAGLAGLPGGYVGVDVFFVISGFLITGLIIDEMASGRFSWSQFYLRRIRRLLPAAYFVLLCCIPPALIWLAPEDLVDFGQSLIAVVTYTSNHLFFIESDYFATEAALKPLLHTWSLAIEEQYYLIFPVLMWCAFKVGRWLALLLCVSIFIASLVYSVWATANAPDAGYYLLPSRAFELMIGSLCAFCTRTQWTLPRHTDAAGLLCVLTAMLTFNDETAFPGLHALLPTIGTALLILGAGSHSITTRCLSARPMVLFGLMSYSLYLWHQPVITFLKHASVDEPSIAARSVALIMCFGLAWFSWRFIEQPARNKSRVSHRLIILAAAVFSLLIIGAGLLLQWDSGHSYRQTKSGQSYAQLSHRFRANRGLDDRCGGRVDVDYCEFGRAPDSLVWGDSHAMHVATALQPGAEETGFYQRTKSNCAPVLDLAAYKERHGVKAVESCLIYNNAVLEWLKTKHSINTVILAATWKILDSPVVDTKLQVIEPDDAKLALAMLDETVSALHALGKKTVIVAPTPRARFNAGQCVHKSMLRGLDTTSCDLQLHPQPSSGKRTLAALATFERSPVVKLTDMLCENNVCKAVIDGIVIYKDSSHLTVEGSLWLGRTHGLYAKLKEAAILPTGSD